MATGKTTICIDTIISQARLNKAAEAAGDKEYRPLYCIYVAIGQKQSTIARVIAVLEEAGAMPYTIVVTSSASDSAANQYLVPFAGAAMGEWFMDNGMDALIVYDDLSKHAVAYRQVCARVEAPVGSRGVSRRRVLPAQPACSNARRASARSTATARSPPCPSSKRRPATFRRTSRPTSSRLPTGRSFWKPNLFYQGVRPAINVGISVSRVGSAAQLKAMKQVAGQLKGELAQFRELAAFAQFGSDLDAKTQAQIDRGKRIMEIFKQGQYNPIPVEIQVAVIWTVQNGYVDHVPVERVKEFQNKLTEYFTTRKRRIARQDRQGKRRSATR